MEELIFHPNMEFLDLIESGVDEENARILVLSKIHEYSKKAQDFHYSLLLNSWTISTEKDALKQIKKLKQNN